MTQRNSKLITEHAFKSFSKISEFVSSLKDVICLNDKFHEVILYDHLLTKTKLSNKHAINKHIQLFNEFCIRNQDSIFSKDIKKMGQHKISYSSKVYIDLYTILNLSELDKDIIDTIWNHLLVIQATIDPTSEAKEILRKLKETSSNEGKLLESFMTKIEKSIDKDKIGSDPLSAATSILKGGLLNDLVGSIDNGVKNGELDLGQLIGTVQQMLGGLTGQVGGENANPLGSMMIMMSQLMGMSGGNSSMDPDKMKASIEEMVEKESKANK